MAEVYCGSEPCPLFLNSTCVFYTGESLLYIGVQNNDTLEAIIVKINQAFQNAGVGYAFTNGLIQPTPFQPVQLGGALIQNTTIGGNFTLTFAGNVQAARHITTGGTSSQFVKGDGTLDSTAYQPAANYITGLSGDATASGPGVAAMTLATVNFSSGTFGNGNTIPIVTVNAKGLVTNITPVPVTIPPLPLTFIGDVVGSGFTGSSISLLLQNVNANPYNTITPLKFSVNGKGLVTSASPITASDIVNILGYNPGTSGTSGTDGTSGTSGTTGTSGTSGTSATSGTSGTTGTSGTSATSGTSGTSGTDGTGGTSGTSGSTGTSGTAGTSGTTGTSGTSGTTGSSGTSGTSGSTGTSGSSGTTGTSGSSGTTGTSGSSGTSGTTGVDGTSGTSGTTGTSGSSGLSGDRFKTTSTTTYTLQAPGNPGTLTVDPGLAYTVAQSIIIAYDANNHNEAEVTSYNSITGVINFVTFTLTGSGTYSNWFVNIDGASGGDGSSGSSGTSGTSATAGTSGTTGTSGSSGTSGTTGTSGSSGTSGTSATNGTGGTSGTSGSSGTSGTTGTSGTSATSGTSGTSATSGTTGTSGTSGTNGTGGTSGTSGSSATSGTSGTSGVNGAPGASGTSGTSGTSVAVSGTTNTMAKFTSATTIGNSLLTDNGSTLTYTGSSVTSPTINVNSGNSFVAQSANNNGGFAMNNSSTYWGLMWNYAPNDWRLGYGSTTAQIGWNLRWDNGSTVWANGSFRAPLFYDSDNTGYYIDGAGTSVLNALTVGGSSVVTNNGGTWGINITGSAGSAGSATTASYVDGTSGGAIRSWDIRTISPSSMTAYRLGFGFTSWANNNSAPYADYLHLRSYSDGSGGADNLVTFLKSGIGMRIWQQSFGSGSAYSSYVDVLHSSNYSAYALPLSGGIMTGNIQMGNNQNLNIKFRTASGWDYSLIGQNDDFFIRDNPGLNYVGCYYNGGGANRYISLMGSLSVFASGKVTYTDATYMTGSPSFGFRFNNSADTINALIVDNSGNTFAYASHRAPIFYDSNDTFYFVDPNSTSRLSTVTAYGEYGSYRNDTQSLLRSYNTSAGSPLQFYLDHSFGNVNIGNNRGIVYAGGTYWEFANSARAPIFYDSNNTGFYVDPASTTNLNTTLAYSYQGNGNVGGTGSASWHPSGIYCGGTMWQYGDMYKNNTPIYDVQNIFNSGWYRNYGRQGVYSQSYGLHFYPHDTNYWSITGSGGSSFGLQFRSNYDSTVVGYVYGDTGGSFGLLSGGSWAVRTFSGGGELVGSWTSTGDYRAPIFYDSNNTGFYLNPASSSNLDQVFAGQLLSYNAVTAQGSGWNTYLISLGFGGYLRCNGHLVLDQSNSGYNIYVLDSNNVGVVKNFGSQSWSTFSDKTIKNIHSVMENNLSKLDGINPIYYSFNNFDDDRNRIGLIAQEVQEHFPELVEREPKTNKLTLDYTGLIPVLLGAIKELKTEVETLKTKI